MKIRSVKTNYILNIIRILSSTFIGVFTMPYINKVLGPGSLGKVEYVNSIITYFILFSALGIPIYGIRQIAKVRQNPTELSRNLLELLSILIFMSILAYIILFAVFTFSTSFSNYYHLIVLMSSMILLNNLGCEWFFQGIEDQLYITVRYLAVRIITVILLFTMVKSESDYLAYAVIVILNFGGSNVLNFYKITKYIRKKDLTLKVLNFKRHLRPALTIFLASVSVSIYLQIDNFLLGYMAGDKYVGYYSVANKLLRYVIIFITSIGAVLLPRLSNLWDKDKGMYEYYLEKSFHFIFIISLPFTIYFYFFAEGIINLMAGSAFYESIITLKILSPVCFLVAMAYFFGYLVLYTQHKEKAYTISVAISALISIISNIILIKLFNQNGAAMSQLISEFLGITFLLIFTIYHRMFKLKEPNSLYKMIMINLLIILGFSFANISFKADFIYLVSYTVLFFGAYLVGLLLVKDKIVMESISIAKNMLPFNKK